MKYLIIRTDKEYLITYLRDILSKHLEKGTDEQIYYIASDIAEDCSEIEAYTDKEIEE